MRKYFIKIEFFMIVVLMCIVSPIALCQGDKAKDISFFSGFDIVDILNTGFTGFAILVLLLGYRLTSKVQTQIIEQDPNNFKDLKAYKEWSKLMKSQLSNTRYFIIFCSFIFLGGLSVLYFLPENEIIVHINPYQDKSLNPVIIHRGKQVDINERGYSKFKVKNEQTIQLSVIELIKEVKKLKYNLEDTNKILSKNTNIQSSNSTFSIKTKNELYVEFEKAKKNKNRDVLQLVSNNLGMIADSEGEYTIAKSFFSNEWAYNSDISNEFLKKINIQENQNKVNTYIASGIVYVLKNEPINAVIEYNKALELNPNNVRGLEFKGYALFLLKKYEESLVASNKANTSNPNDLNIILNLLKANCALKKIDIAKQILNNNIDLMNSNIDVVKKDTHLSKHCGNKFFDA